MDNKKPKVLSISLSAWRTDSNIHTQTDLFKYMEPENVAQIYTRSEYPNTPVCNKFFQISENAVIKSLLNRKYVGKVVENGKKSDNANVNALNQEQKLYSFAHKKKSWFFTLLREIVWSLGKWRSPALLKFVEDFDADVYFVPIYNVVFMAKIQLYILKKFPKPYVAYLWDDNYSYMNCGKNIFSYIHRAWLRKYVKKLAENSTEMFTITKTQGKETDKCFGTKSIVLTKGVDYTGLEYNEIVPKKPLKMVYTGNLLIGREASMVAISKAMANINKDETRVTLDIYSPTMFDKATMDLLNSNGCTHHGNVPHTQVAELQKSADVVVFVESLEKQHKYAARLSFSTKLTDYFKSGKCIFAIGDKGIAPIEYLAENDAAVISTDYSQVEDNLRMIIEHPELLNKYGKNAFLCGKENHNEDLIKRTFLNAFDSAWKK